MQHENWSCPKCDHKEYEVGENRVAGSFWSKIFNVQNKKYALVTMCVGVGQGYAVIIENINNY